MPVSATDLLKKLIAKSGIVYAGDLSADIPDDVANSIDNSLLTIAAATNNHPDVKKVYFAQAYNGLDAEIKALVTEYGLPDDVVAEIEKAGGSTKKAVALARKLKELGEKAQPSTQEEAKKLAATITELHGKLKAEMDKQKELETDFNKKVKQLEIKQRLDKELSKYKTVFDEHDPVIKESSINALLSKALQDSDAEFTFDDKGNLSLVKKDGNTLFGDNHMVVTPQSFIDKSLSKILKVTQAANGGTIASNPATTVPGGQNSKNAALDAAIDDALKSYETGKQQAVAL